MALSGRSACSLKRTNAGSPFTVDVGLQITFAGIVIALFHYSSSLGRFVAAHGIMDARGFFS